MLFDPAFVFCDENDDDERLASRLRPRAGALYAPTFNMLVDGKCDCFEVACRGPVITTRAFRRNLDPAADPDPERLAVVQVNVAYRAGTGDVTASSVWDSAVVLGASFLGGQFVLPPGATVIELGAGTGLCGLCAGAAMGAAGGTVLLTDLESSLPGLLANVALNHRAQSPTLHVSAHALPWGRATAQEFGERMLRHWPSSLVLLAADCLLPYDPDLLVWLAQTIGVLLQNFGDARSVAVVAYEERFDVSPFFAALAAEQLSCTPVDRAVQLHPHFQASQSLHVVCIRAAGHQDI